MTQSKPQVFIITCADRQKDGTYHKSIHSVFTTLELAREELRSIAKTFNQGGELYANWRAHAPQVDDLSLDLMVDRHYQCQAFYSIRMYEIKA